MWKPSTTAGISAQYANEIGCTNIPDAPISIFDSAMGALRRDEMKEYPRHPNSKRFHQLLDEIGQLHDRKQADYGRGDDPFANVRASAEWGMPSWVGAMVRLTDKVRRLQSLATKGSLANEAAKDSFLDIAVYALIAYILFEDEGTR